MPTETPKASSAEGTETTGLPSITIGYHADTVNGSVSLKHRSNRIFGSTEAEIPYKNIFHFYFPLQLQNSESWAGSDMGGGPDNAKDA